MAAPRLRGAISKAFERPWGWAALELQRHGHLHLCRSQHTAQVAEQRGEYRRILDALGFKSFTSDEDAPLSRPGSGRIKLVEHQAGLRQSNPRGPQSLARILGLDKNLTRIQLNNTLHRFDNVFLRDACSCIACRDPDSGQKRFETCDIPADISVRNLWSDTKDCIHLQWKSDVPGYSRDHTTKLTGTFLKRMAEPSLRTNPTISSSQPWTADQYKAEFGFHDYGSFMTDFLITSKVLRDLRFRGLAFINNVPGHESSVEKIAGRIGPLRDTFYGRTWDVKEKPHAENVAYTSEHLGLHMDLLYMKNPPGFQFLHCIKSSDNGGVSMFSDAYSAARVIENLSSKAFKDLATFPVRYAYKKGGHSYADEKPVFELSAYIHAESKLSLTDRLAAVNWSPPFQGHLNSNIGSDGDSRQLRDWHRATTAFKAIISSPQNLFEHKLESGQCVVFNNRRVLHGRTAFAENAHANSELRWLRGAYVDTDAFNSAYTKYHDQTRDYLSGVPEREVSIL